MEDAIRSKLQFDNPVIRSFTFESNKEFDENKYQGYGVRHETRIEDRTSNSAYVTFSIEIGDDPTTVPFMIRASVRAYFHWEDNIPEKMVNKLLKQNANILLLSYLRPFIAHLTVDAGYEPFVLPFFDFSSNSD